MGIKPSAEIPGEDSGAEFANDQIGPVYANVRIVAENIDDVVLVADGLENLPELSEVAATVASGIADAEAAEAAAAASAAAAAASAVEAAEASGNVTAAVEAAAAVVVASVSGSVAAAAASATAAAGSATAAAGSATSAATQATDANAAKVAALAAQAAAEAAAADAEAIVGGDFVPNTDRGVADGVATLDSGTKIPIGQIPAIAVAGVTGLQATLDAKALLAGGNSFVGDQTIDGYITATGFSMTGGYSGFQSGGTEYAAFVSTPSAFYSAVTGEFSIIDYDTEAFWATFTATGLSVFGSITATDIIVSAEAYGPGWNGSNEVPTKNDIYDKIVALEGLVVGAMVYQGTWDATANSPAIPAAAAGNKGYFYKVATAGTTSISGIAEWAVGDWIVSNGASWDKIDNTETVSSVAGLSGAISASGLKTAMSFVKADVGLGSVDNTADTAKPVSTAQQAALDLKQNRSPDIQAAGANSITPTFSDNMVNNGAVTAAPTLNNPTGTAIDCHKIIVRIKANGAYAISYGSQYRAIGVTLPTATVNGKWLYLGMIFNNADTKWDVVGVSQEV
jgi:hypothetical protein